MIGVCATDCAPVSIHAPPARCDTSRVFPLFRLICFNPRTPCEVRLVIPVGLESKAGFQSTHPLRGATLNNRHSPLSELVSIHAPPARCDIDVGTICKFGTKFQSTHPLRGATCRYNINPVYIGFQSTHPLRGATVLLLN